MSTETVNRRLCNSSLCLHKTLLCHSLTLILLTWRIWWAPTNACKWQMGFNSAFKGLIQSPLYLLQGFCKYIINITDTTYSSIHVTLWSKHAKFKPKVQESERYQTIRILKTTWNTFKKKVFPSTTAASDPIVTQLHSNSNRTLYDYTSISHHPSA